MMGDGISELATLQVVELAPKLVTVNLSSQWLPSAVEYQTTVTSVGNMSICGFSRAEVYFSMLENAAGARSCRCDAV
jgi:hypothetical protein